MKCGKVIYSDSIDDTWWESYVERYNEDHPDSPIDVYDRNEYLKVAQGDWSKEC